jgi:polyhydroxybutyrate depolymerase
VGRIKVEPIEVDGLKRIYSIHFPKGREKETGLPLLIALHGAKGSYKKPETFTNFNQVSDQNGFIIVYPNAMNTQWNDGRKKGDTPSFYVDDVHFLTVLIDSIIRKYGVDPTRVYMSGFSSGGMMTSRFALEKPEKVAAIATVSATLPQPQFDKKIDPKPPLPVLMINGDHDVAFPWNGGTTKFAGIRVGKVTSVEDTLQYWIKINGGEKASPLVLPLPDLVMDGTQVEKRVYETEDGPQVILYKVLGGGHSWPGAHYPVTYLPRFILGKTSQQLNACQVIWDFVKNYSRYPEESSKPVTHSE